ncbi:hypothetical protein RFI_19384, partial [Reticulomyxa filosa]
DDSKESSKRVLKACPSAFCTLVLTKTFEHAVLHAGKRLNGNSQLATTPVYVDEKAMNYLCEVALGTGKLAKLASVLQTIFSSPSILNGSFPSTRNMYHLLPDTGLDLESLQRMYRRVLTIDPKVTNALIKAMTHIGKTSGRFVRHQHDALTLRYYFILIIFPELLNASFNHHLTSMLNDTLLSVNNNNNNNNNNNEEEEEELRIDMIHWLCQWDLLSRRLLLQRLQDCLTMFIELKEKMDGYILRFVMVIDFLWRANQKIDNVQDRLHFKEFYNRTLTRANLIDFRSDYIRWMSHNNNNNNNNKQSYNNLNKTFTFCSYPFILDPVAKREVINIEQQLSRQQHAIDDSLHFSVPFGGFNILLPIPQPYFVMRVRRQYLLQDTMAIITNVATDKPNEFFKELKIVFNGEEGVDQGGVRKEFFQLIIDELFGPKYDCFIYNESTRTHWFNPNSLEDENTFRLLGVIIGLGIYNGVLLDITFPTAVYKKLCDEKLGLHDLTDWDPVLGKSLEEVVHWSECGKDTRDLCLTFCVVYQTSGEIKSHDLISNGSSIEVNNENALAYVEKLVDWHLNESIASQFKSFAKGFHRVVGRSAFGLFIGEELEKLIVGNPVLDFDALEVTTKYEGGYHSEHPAIRLFWRVIKSFDEENKKKFLLFTTGSYRAPLRGLGKLGLVIHRVGSDPYDGEMLPTSHTCFNALMLPAYSTLEIMQEKLTRAIQYSQGFGLQ